MAIKTRSFMILNGTTKMEEYISGAVPAHNTYLYPYSLNGVQSTSSVGHPFRSSLYRRAIQDLGGGFSTATNECDGASAHISIDVTNGVTRRTFSGPIFAWDGLYNNINPSFAQFLVPSNAAAMSALGTSGIAMSLPTNPLAGMDQFIGELRDLPKAFDVPNWKSRSKNYADLQRRFGKDWLNLQFGWVPFVKDVRSFTTSALNHSKIIAQYERDSGKNIRRRRTVFQNTTITGPTELGNAYGSPVLPTNMYSSPGKLTKTVSTTRKVWFSGCFTYYLPKVETKADVVKYGLALSKKLYGLKLDAQTLYALTPWSWALDWVTNTGSVIRNLSAFSQDGLVMRYGYVMETITETTTYTLKGLTFKGYAPLTLSQSFRKTVKTRQRATPYGFGLNPSSFTARQWGIIAALGISKKPRSLDI